MERLSDGLGDSFRENLAVGQLWAPATLSTLRIVSARREASDETSSLRIRSCDLTFFDRGLRMTFVQFSNRPSVANDPPFQSRVTPRHDGGHRATSRPLTPLMRAAAIGHVELVRELLVDARLHQLSTVNERGPRESTALMFAAGGGHFDIVQLLVEHGANPFLCEDGGWCALDHAMADGEEEVVRYLASVMEQLRPGRTGAATRLTVEGPEAV